MHEDEQHSLPFPYTVRTSDRARYVRLTIDRAARVVMTIPRHVSIAVAQAFFRKKVRWIERVLQKMKSSPRRIPLPRTSRREYLRQKEQARKLVLERLAYWNQSYAFTYHRVAIRMTRSRWGSCSSKGNLNFGYRLIFLPAHLVDYIIVHELCHLVEHNHGKNFWQLVAKTIPSYQESRKQLKSFV